MLVLGRRIKQRVRLRIEPSEEETLVWVSVESPNNNWSNNVRLGFDSPDHVEILREELITKESENESEMV